MITKITCRYSFEVLDFHSNDFGFTFNIGVSYLGIYKTSMPIPVYMMNCNSGYMQTILLTIHALREGLETPRICVLMSGPLISIAM